VLGRRVWSDDDVQKLAFNFLCAADEVWCLEHLDGAGPKFFQEFGKKLPPGQWGEGTKQGVYVMTADGEYLGAHHGRHSKEQTLELLRGALERWEKIVKEKGLRPQPIPRRATKRRWEGDGVAARAGGSLGAGAALILQVNSRDLPRADGRFSGPPEYRNAWNQNWLDFSAQDAAEFLPKNGVRTEVPSALFRRVACAALVDNVRGQTGSWPEAAVQKAKLTTEPVSTEGDAQTLRFEGEFRAEEAARSYDGKLYGKAVYDARMKAFTRFELVAVGVRTGGTGQANFRSVGEGASALGVSFILEGQYDRSENQKTKD
jgi:hypothetical protein